MSKKGKPKGGSIVTEDGIELCYLLSSQMDLMEIRSNMEVMAAAPDLLNALLVAARYIHIVHFANPTPQTILAIKLSEEAIAKATGEAG